MSRLQLIFGIILLITGCASHTYEVKGDTLDLYLNHPDAKEVTFACSLDDFEPHDARKIDGRWVVSVPSQHTFRYYYVLDGEMFLPPCKLKENDDFGSKNCIFTPHL